MPRGETRLTRGARRSAPAAQAPDGMAAERQEGRAAPGESEAVARVGYAPIVRVDDERREIEMCATSDAVDSHGTVFDYAASKDAFTRWVGNVREMHERRAVGRRVQVRCDDGARKIFVRVRISRGAQDTWEKIRDGTLRGASIGASNVVWERQVRRVAGGERVLNVATRYDLVELSLVDNPSNPDTLGITLVRDAAPDVALLDELAEPPRASLVLAATAPESPVEPVEPVEPDAACGCVPLVQPAMILPQRPLEARETAGPAEERVEQRLRGPFSTNDAGVPDVGVPARAEERPTSALTAPAEGNARERFHAAARGILHGCGCPLCEGALAALGEAGTERHAALRAAGAVEALREGAVARALASGLSASVARLDRMDDSVRGMQAILRAAVSQMAGTVGDLRLRLDALEQQPLPGGPAARPVEKRHALAPEVAGQPGPVEQYRALESLAGRLTDPQAQIAVAAEMIRLQRAGG
jgi:phage head maturation protease